MTEPRDIEIEVFRADTEASKGLTARDIAAGIAKYDASRTPAPLVKGHPASDAPAYGSIKAFRQEGARLFATLSNVATDFIDEVKSGKWLNRSMAFWAPDHPSNPAPGTYYPKHLGFLGASQPAIAGMDPMKFSADETVIEAVSQPHTAIIFAAPDAEATPIAIVTGEPEVADKPEFTAEDIQTRDARIAELEAQATARAAADTEARKAADKAFCAQLADKGQISPAQRDDLEKIFAAMPDDAIEFDVEHKESAGAGLKRFLGNLPEQINFTAMAGPDGQPQGAPQSAEDLVLAANNFVASEKDKGRSVTFDAALDHVKKGA